MRYLKLFPILLLLMMLGPQANAAEWWKGPCRGMSVRGTIACATARWPVPGGLAEALRIAERESNFIPGATSPSGTYRGVYQIGAYHITDRPSWPDNVMQGPWWDRWFPFLHTRDPNLLYNHRFNVLLAVRVAHFGGWGPWSL